MDRDQRLRYITPEELLYPDQLDHPVESVADLPAWKLSEFKLVDKAGFKS